MNRGTNIIGQGSRLFFQPLEFVFNVGEEGGTFVQTKDTVTNEYIPDRRMTPIVLRPSLYVRDPSGFIEDGDRTDEMSVTWTYDGSVVKSTDATLSDNIYLSGKNLVIKSNLNKTFVKVEFDGVFTDKRRGENHNFHKEWNFTLQAATQEAISMSIDQPKVVRLSPFSPYDIVPISCQLFEGPSPLDDSYCTYTWQYKDGTSWTDISDLPLAKKLWLSSVSGKTIKVLQEHIQSIELRCVGIVKALSTNSAYTQYQQVRLYRYIGDVQKPKVVRTKGAVLTLDSTVVARKVELKYSGGDIAAEDILKNFSIHWFYAFGITSKTWNALDIYDSVEASMTIDPQELKKDTGFYYDGVVMGAEVLPLTALLPLTATGKYLTFGGKVLTAKEEVYE